jgi:hypothetical protein
MPLGENSGLVIQAGGRMATVTELKYENPAATDQKTTVYKNAATGSTLAVDFSGAYLKIGLRSYFKPTHSWRKHPR